jgi:hypothetical protein
MGYSNGYCRSYVVDHFLLAITDRDSAATATAAQEKRENNTTIDPHAVGNYDVEMGARRQGNQ